MKRYDNESKRFTRLLQHRIEKHGSGVTEPLHITLAGFTLSDSIFRHIVLQNRVIDKLVTTVVPVTSVFSSIKQVDSISQSNTGSIILPVLLAGVVYGVLKNITLPSIESFKPSIRIPPLREIITEKYTNLKSIITDSRFPEIDIVNVADDGEQLSDEDYTVNTPDNRSIIEQALDRIYVAKVTVESIYEGLKIRFLRISENASALSTFITTGPYAAVNLLLGKKANLQPIRRSVETFVSNFWNNTSSYIRDLFKWIQLKDIVDPVLGLSEGFTGFISNAYSSFVRSFTISNNTTERETTQSSTLLFTASIFSRLTSTFVKFTPVPLATGTLATISKTVKKISDTLDTEYETVTETVSVNSNNIWVMGDSIALGYKKQKGYAGTPVSGQTPEKILSTQIPEFMSANSSNQYSVVVLSSGLSNSPTKQSLSTVDSILQKLTNVQVVLFGVSNIKHSYTTKYGKFTHDGPWLNSELSKIAGKYRNVKFTGPIPESATSKDNIHATNYDWVGNIEKRTVVTRKVPNTTTSKQSTDTNSTGNSSINSSVVQGTAQSEAMNRAIRWIIANSKGVIVRPGYAQKGRVGQCARWVRLAIQHAGIPLRATPVSACDYHNHGTLKSAGFVLVGQGNHSTSRRPPPGLKTGDVIVTQRISGHPHGHISITINDSGEQATDYLQKNLFDSGRAYGIAKAPYYVYRYVGKGNSGTKQSSTKTSTHKQPSKPSNGKTGIGGSDIKVPVQATTPTKSFSFKRNKSTAPNSASKTLLSSTHDFISQIRSVSSSPIVRVVDEHSSVILATSNTTATVIYDSGTDILLHTPGNTGLNGNISTKELPGNSGQYVEIPGIHPLEILFSGELSRSSNLINQGLQL